MGGGKVRRIKWPDQTGGPQLERDDLQSRALRQVREAFEKALPNNFGTGEVTIDQASKLFGEKHGASAPSRSTLYNVFSAFKGTDKSVARCLEAAGVPHGEAEQLARAYFEARTGGKPAAEAGDPRERQRFADIAVRVRAAREQWDSASPGDPAYRDPELSLPRDELSTAYTAALDGALSREDVAFCLYSAAKHRKDYAAWVALCPASEDAAEVLLDLILVPRPGEMVRPIVRAAWTMQRLDDEYRSAACEVGLRLAAERTDGMDDLLAAIREKQVEQLMRRRLAAGFYADEDARKIQEMLDKDWASPASLVGARGLVHALLRDVRHEDVDL